MAVELGDEWEIWLGIISPPTRHSRVNLDRAADRWYRVQVLDTREPTNPWFHVLPACHCFPVSRAAGSEEG